MPEMTNTKRQDPKDPSDPNNPKPPAEATADEEQQHKEQLESFDVETMNWNGQTRYKCPLKWEGGDAPCEYDSHDLNTLREHMKMAHTLSGKHPVIQKPVETGASRPAEADPDLQGVRFAQEGNQQDKK